MRSNLTKAKESGRRLVDVWRTFWLRPEPAYTLGLIRIAFGVLITLWSLEILSQLDVWFSSDGIYPTNKQEFPNWSIFEWWGSDDALLIGAIVLLISAVALTLGFQTRVAAILVYVLVMSFERRNMFLFNAGDDLIRIEALFLALAPCGAALSLDQRRRTGSFWSAQAKAIWPVRLMQIQVTIIYLDSVISKMRGENWHDGSAVSFSLRNISYSTGVVPGWLDNNAILMNLATWTALAVEFSIAVLVWNRRLRPWVIGAGILLHLGIFITLRVAFFSPAIFVLYVAFLPTDRAKAVADYLQKTLQKPLKTRTREKPQDADGRSASTTQTADATTLPEPAAETKENASLPQPNAAPIPPD